MLYTRADFARRADRSEKRARLPYSINTASEYGRIVHSAAFRRLQGKMQLFPASESPLLRNRLTHSLEVADVASKIASIINTRDGAAPYKIDLSIVAAAALGHDIGHPPFGHSGEKALARFMANHGSFEGNAQTLRVLTRLENRIARNSPPSDPLRTVYENPLGLNLMARTIASVLKYDNRIKKRNRVDEVTKGYYSDDSEAVEFSRQHVVRKNQKHRLRTLECQIMDIADDIAYSTYDLDDCMISGLLTPLDLIAVQDELASKVAHEMSRNLRVKYGYWKESRSADGELFQMDAVEPEDVTVVGAKIVESIFPFSERSGYSINDIIDKILYVSNTYFGSTAIATEPLLRRQFTEKLIRQAVESINVKWNDEEPALSKIEIDIECLLKIEMLRHFNYFIAILSPRLQTYSGRAEHIIATICGKLFEDEKGRLIPPEWKSYYNGFFNGQDPADDDTKRMRITCDYVASLTDHEAIRLYSRVIGTEERSVFGY